MARTSPLSEGAAALTLSEWQELGDEVGGELIDGVLVEEEVPDYVHELLVGLLIHLVGAWAFPRGGLVAGSDAKFAVGPRRGRKPDLTVFLPGGAKPPRRGLVRIPPDIAVEVISPSPRDGRRDRVEKMDDYAAFGIRYYWLVDPELQSLEIFELMADGRYARAAGASTGSVAVPGCDGLELDLNWIWRQVASLDS